MKKSIVKRMLPISIAISLILASADSVYAWNMPQEGPPEITDSDYTFPSFSNGERLLGKSEVNDLPALGWNSWHACGSGIYEKDIKETADAFISLGLKDAGYEYVVMDDGCYADSRGADGKLTNNQKFPSGFKNLSDYIHDLGLKFGMYNDVGTRTCAGQAGLYGNEDIDAQSFADWGVDYLKVDFCDYPWSNSRYAVAGDDPYSTAPRIRSITLSDNAGFNETLNAVEDGTAVGKAVKDTANNYVYNIQVVNFSYEEEHWGELEFNVSAPASGTYDLVVEYAGGNNDGRWLQVAVGPLESEVRYFDELLSATGNNTTFQDSPTISVSLEAGNNVIRLMNYRRQENALQSYAGLYDGLSKAGVADTIKLSICEWGKTNAYYWGYKVGDSWRTANDITFGTGVNGKARWSSTSNPDNPGNSASIMSQYNWAVVLDEYAGLDRGWNDPDMMVVGMIDEATGQRFSEKVDISHFTLWCMLNAPIMLGVDLRNIEEGSSVHKVITNADAIALNQDALGVQAKRIYTSGGDGDPSKLITSLDGRIDVLAKPLENGDFALTFLNTGTDTVNRTASVDIDLILEKIGHKMTNSSAVQNAKAFLIKDIWTKEEDFQFGTTFEVTVGPQETKTIRVTPYGTANVALESSDGKLTANYTIINDAGNTVNAKLYLAEYDASGCFQKISYKDISNSDTIYSDKFEITMPGVGKTVRAFLWEEGTNKPLCSYAEYKITSSNKSTAVLAKNAEADEAVTMSLFVKMILDSSVGEIEPTDDYPASGYLKHAFDMGIIQDINYTDAEQPLSRKEAARIGHEALQRILEEEDESDISAAENLEDLYSCRTCVMHIAQMYTKGIMSGKTDGLFHGDDNITTEEAKAMIMKMMEPTLRDDVKSTLSSEEPDTGKISSSQVKEIMNSCKNALLIDVRSQEEYDTGYIPGSICVPELTDRLPASFASYDKDTLMIVYCQKGSRSLKAYNVLTDAGYTNVYNLGGIEEWPYELESDSMPEMSMASAANPTITITTVKDTSTVNVKISGASSLQEEEISVVCYKPQWNGTSYDISKTQQQIVYLNQQKLNNGMLTFSFKVNETPVKGGYTFAMVTSSGRNTKKFSFIQEHKVTLNPNGGSVSKNTIEVTDGEAIGELPKPTRSGYIFTGWYTSKTGGSVVNAATKVTAPMTIFAHWKEAPLAVGKEFQSGSLKYKVVRKATEKSKGSVLVIGTSNNKLTKISIPASVKHATYDYKVEKIAKKAFKNNKKLKRLVVANSVSEIQNEAFSGCSALTNVSLGTGIKKLGNKVFYNDKKIQNITISSKKLKTVGKGAFKKVNSNATIKVPSGKANTYRKLFRKKGLPKSVKVK